MSKIFVTGAGGFIGSAFLAQFMLQHPDAAVFALMRAHADAPSPRARLATGFARALHAAYDKSVLPETLAGRVDILTGDAAQPNCGLSPDAMARLEAVGIDQIWHIAADLRVTETLGAKAGNVRAANEIMQLAARIGCSDVVLVSTAYVFGRRDGPIAADEPLPERIEANNPYEISKFDAEREACRLAGEKAIRLTLLRPTVVVGHSQTKSSAGSTSGLYGMVRALDQEVARRNLPSGGRISLRCGAGALNFVCIDHVVDAMMAVTGAGKPNAPLTIKAITGTDIEVEKTLAAIADRLDIEILRTDGEQDVSPDDRLINRHLDFFRPYAEVATRKQFAGAQADDARQIYDIDLVNLVEAGLRESRFGCLADLLRLRHIARPDASPLIAYESHEPDGHRPTTVIVNAYGMPIDVMHPLIHDLLASGRRVVSWDCRGLPDRSYDITAGGLSIESQLDDWALIRDNLTSGPVDLIGWSTGAVVASRIAAEEPQAVRSLVLLHGSYMHKGAELTAFQKNLKSVMPKVALSRSVAGLLYKSVFSENKGALLKLMTRDIARKSEEAMSVTQPAHKHIVQMLTGNPEDVFRYARLIRAFVQETPLAWLSDITCPTLLVTGPKDATAHPKGSYDAAEHIRGSRLHVAENGDHFSFYSDAAVRRVIVSALDSAPANTLQDATTP